MCLIISGNANKIRTVLLNTPNMLEDIFKSNSDGIGFMYGSKKGLKVIKVLPKNMQETRDFIGRIPTDDRDFAIHFRMTTHGDTDLSNCHPYEVAKNKMAMMHNGILTTGNAADRSKSDTWHFIKDYLASPIQAFPELAYNEAYLTMVAELIGNNRFVFMNNEGRMSHVNYDQGIEHDGLWFSNTYAWSPYMLIPTYKRPAYSKYSNWDNDNDFAPIDTFGYGKGYTYGKANTSIIGTHYPIKHTNDAKVEQKSMGVNGVTRSPRAHEANYAESAYDFPLEDHILGSHTLSNREIFELQEDFADYINDANEVGVARLLTQFPFIVDEFLSNNRAMASSAETTLKYSSRDAMLIDALYAEDLEAIHTYLETGVGVPAQVLAEIMCYYLFWVAVETLDV